MMRMGGPGMMLQGETSKPTAVATTLRRFWRYFRKYQVVLLSVAFLVAVSTYMQVLVPDLLGQAVDCYIAPATQQAAGAGASFAGSGTTASSNCWYGTVPANATVNDYIAGLGGLVLLMVGLYVASSLLTGLMFYLMTWTGQHVLRTLRVEVFRHIHRLSIGYFTKHEAGDVMSRITNDADT